MPIYNYSINDNKFITKESILSKKVMGMEEKEAVKLVERSGCLAFIEQRDKQRFYLEIPTAHSYRLRLAVKRGRVVSVSVG